MVTRLIHGKAPRHRTRRKQRENERNKPHVEIVCLRTANQERRARKVVAVFRK
jgi:hypothetical protein